jgi:hypothetical protein
MAVATLRSSALDQLGHTVGKLCAVALPECDAVVVETQSFGTFLGQRVVVTDTFDEPAIATIARICHHYIVEWTPFGATTGKPDNNHSRFSLCSEKGKARILLDFPVTWQGKYSPERIAGKECAFKLLVNSQVLRLKCAAQDFSE